MNRPDRDPAHQLFRKDANLASAKLRRADTFIKRLRGLLGRRGLPAGEALWIAPCTSVHTFFMQFSIDVAFIDGEGRIVSLRENVPPGRLAFARRAKSVLEFAAGNASRLGLLVGQQLEWSSIEAGRSPLTVASLRRQGKPS